MPAKKKQIDLEKANELWSLLSPLEKDFKSDARRLVVADWLDENLPLTPTLQDPVPNWLRLRWIKTKHHRYSDCGRSVANEIRNFGWQLSLSFTAVDHDGVASIFGVPCHVTEPYCYDDAGALLAMREIAEITSTYDIFTRNTWHARDVFRENDIIRRVILFPRSMEDFEAGKRRPRRVSSGRKSR